MKPEFFNQLIGIHALVMIFAALMPAATGFAKLDDTADDRRPRHGLAASQQLGFLAVATGGILLTLPFTLALFGIGDGALATGWTFTRHSRCRAAWASTSPSSRIHILGISSIMGSINIIVTIFNMRAPG
jgi:cytochrome c oxidase subunit 1